MEDFIFGTLATDELKLLNYRAKLDGVQHRHRVSPRVPVPGEPVHLTVTIGQRVEIEHVVCYYTTDGSEPSGSKGVPEQGNVVHFVPGEVKWDSMLWGYYQFWTVDLPPQASGVLVNYKIGAFKEGCSEVFADWPDGKRKVMQSTHAFYHGRPFPNIDYGNPNQGLIFNYRVGGFESSGWIREAVIYQVFIDRFYPGDDRGWHETSDLEDFHGGTLWGVRDKLDFIKQLGASCIWLSPTCCSPTYHGYDVTDYKRVEPRLGGDEALRALVEHAHNNGIRVLLDLVCNHLSVDHPIFQEALHDPGSKYRDWFIFDESQLGYRSFFGVAAMPQLNLHNSEARKWMIDIGRFWIREFDVDGYRLDHANGPGPDFWTEFTASCVEEKDDVFIFGEVVEPSNSQRAYFGHLHGLLDFNFCDALRNTFGKNLVSETQFYQFLDQHLAFFDDPNFLMPSFFDNHDMDRFSFITKGDMRKLQAAAEIQFSLPGPPIIYYGTEVGVGQSRETANGGGLDQSRKRMLWGAEQNEDLLSFYRSLIENRMKAQPWNKLSLDSS
jgi:glycosidase